MNTREIAEPNTILRCEVGSTVHGLGLEGTDDRDEMGVCLEPAVYVIGLRRFEQWVHRTKPQGVRSEAGDLDLVIYSARKWCSLALKGNPSAMLPLFVPEEKCTVLTPAGRALRSLAPAFASKKAGAAFRGYMTQQKQRLLGERGQMNVKRPELVDAHGFDTKYAGHILRLGYQGVEYLTWGKLTLPMPPEERKYIRRVRQGEVPFDEVIKTVGVLESALDGMMEITDLPDEPDYDRVNRWLIETYLDHWECRW
jgi:hypothetical protein